MPSQRTKKPNWNFWRHILDVPLWQAIHLSLDVCPRRTDKKLLLKLEQSREYQDRFAIAESNLISENLERGTLDEDGYETTRLTAFAAFAVSKGWKIPQGLSALAVEPVKAAPQEQPAQAAAEKDKPVDPRERITLHLMIAALLEKARIDVSDTSKTAREIVELIREIGADADYRTIERHLAQIDKAIRRRRPKN